MSHVLKPFNFAWVAVVLAGLSLAFLLLSVVCPWLSFSFGGLFSLQWWILGGGTLCISSAGCESFQYSAVASSGISGLDSATAASSSAVGLMVISILLSAVSCALFSESFRTLPGARLLCCPCCPVREQSLAQRIAWGSLAAKIASGLQVIVFLFAGSAADNFNAAVAVFSVGIGAFSVAGVGFAAFAAFLAALAAIAGASFLCYTAQGNDSYREISAANPATRGTMMPFTVSNVLQHSAQQHVPTWTTAGGNAVRDSGARAESISAVEVDAPSFIVV